LGSPGQRVWVFFTGFIVRLKRRFAYALKLRIFKQGLKLFHSILMMIFFYKLITILNEFDLLHLFSLCVISKAMYKQTKKAA